MSNVLTPSLRDFIGFMYDAVRYYRTIRDTNGNPIRCKRPNAFLPVLDFNDAIPENIDLTDCEKYKKFFYSRKWELEKFNPSKMDYDYPAVIAQWISFSSEDIMGKRNSDLKGCEETHRFQIGVVDQYIKEKGKQKNCEGCDGRNPFEIFLDTKEILDSILLYLKSIKRLVLTNGATITEAWLTMAAADYMVTKGLIDSYTIKTIDTKAYLAMLTNENAQNRGAPFYSLSIRNLYGVYIDFDFTTRQCLSVGDKFLFDKPELKYIKDSCC